MVAHSSPVYLDRFLLNLRSILGLEFGQGNENCVVWVRVRVTSYMCHKFKVRVRVTGSPITEQEGGQLRASVPIEVLCGFSDGVKMGEREFK